MEKTIHKILRVYASASLELRCLMLLCLWQGVIAAFGVCLYWSWFCSWAVVLLAIWVLFFLFLVVFTYQKERLCAEQSFARILNHLQGYVRSGVCLGMALSKTQDHLAIERIWKCFQKGMPLHLAIARHSRRLYGHQRVILSILSETEERGLSIGELFSHLTQNYQKEVQMRQRALYKMKQSMVQALISILVPWLLVFWMSLRSESLVEMDSRGGLFEALGMVASYLLGLHFLLKTVRFT